MRKFCLYLLLSLFPAGGAAAQELLRLMPGSHANSVGTAYSTVLNDPYAVFYNPANLNTLNNLDFRFNIARRLREGSDTGELSAVYSRPNPQRASLVAGAGLHSVRQGPLGADTLVLALGERTVYKRIQQPILYGGAVRLAHLRNGEGSRFGLGADAGILATANSGLKTAVVLTGLMYGLGEIPAVLTIGNSYPLFGGTVMGDFRIRSGHSELFFGGEYDIFNGLVSLRAGKGADEARGDYAAFGVGVKAWPWLIDFAWSLPLAGMNEKAGYYGFTAAYRFGAPSFSSALSGDAARKVEELRGQAAELRTQRNNLESAITAYSVNRNTLQTDVAMLQLRARELEENIRELEARERQAQFHVEAPRKAKRYIPPPPEKWPKRHTVEAGETLRSIASRYYGNPNLWEKIYEANEKLVFKGLPLEGAVFSIPPPPPTPK